MQCVGDVWVGVRAAAVQDDILLGWHAEHLEVKESTGGGKARRDISKVVFFFFVSSLDKSVC